jgi:hypothetical protein
LEVQKEAKIRNMWLRCLSLPVKPVEVTFAHFGINAKGRYVGRIALQQCGQSAS